MLSPIARAVGDDDPSGADPTEGDKERRDSAEKERSASASRRGSLPIWGPAFGQVRFRVSGYHR